MTSDTCTMIYNLVWKTMNKQFLAAEIRENYSPTTISSK